MIWLAGFWLGNLQCLQETTLYVKAALTGVKNKPILQSRASIRQIPGKCWWVSSKRYFRSDVSCLCLTKYPLFPSFSSSQSSFPNLLKPQENCLANEWLKSMSTEFNKSKRKQTKNPTEITKCMLKCIIQLLYSLFASHYTLLCQYTVYLNGNLFVTRNFSSCLYLLVQNTVGTLQISNNKKNWLQAT